MGWRTGLALLTMVQASDVALLLRGISSPRTYEGFDGRTLRTADWRTTHRELRDYIIGPTHADVFLHTWAGAEAPRVLEAYDPVAHVIETERNFSARFQPLVTSATCQASKATTGQRCPRVLQNKFAMFWGIREVCRLLLAHEATRGAAYDFVVNTRFDARLAFAGGAPGGQLALRRPVEWGRLYGFWHAPGPTHPRPFLDDKLFAGDSVIMRAALDAFDALGTYAEGGAAGFEYSNHVNLERAFGSMMADLRPMGDALRRADGGARLEGVNVYRGEQGGDRPTGAFGGACSNNSYILPLRRRRIAPSASALESFQQKIIALARNASALEIGGPTTNIGGLYAQLAWASVDIVNWSEQDGAVTRVETVGAEASSGSAFYVDGRLLGRLRVGDGGRLEHVADGSYDVVMAFHVLEHFADPLRALATWRRVLKPGGYLVVSVPWAENTYDREVPVSTIYDLILAHADAADSSDDPEVLRRLERRVRAYHRLVDLDMCPICSDDLATARRLKGYHWHAWDLSLLQEAMACTGAVVEYLDIMDNWHQLVIARVPAGD